VIGASTGMFGAVWAQAEVRKVMGAIGARVIDRELPVAKADDAFTEDGRLADLELHGELEETLNELVSLAEQVGEFREAAA
jgi:chromate reductase